MVLPLLLIIIPNLDYLTFFIKGDIGYKQSIILFATFILLSTHVALKWLTTKSNFYTNLKLTIIDWLVILFFGVYAVATIFSKSWYISLYGGNNHPPEGLFIIGIFALLYFYAQHIASQQELKKIIAAIAIGLTITLLFGVLFDKGLDVYGGIPLRISAGHGSPLYLAAYLLIGLPIALTLLVSSKESVQFFGFLLTIIVIFELIAGLTRSAWIVAPFLFFIFLKKILGLKYFYALIIGVVGIAIFFYPLIKDRTLNTFTFDPIYNSVIIRIRENLATLKIIKDNPIFGIGPEAVNYVYPQYQSAEINKNKVEQDWQTFFIRNYYLQLGVTVGLIGLSVFLAILIFTTISFINYLPKTSDQNALFLIGVFTSWWGIVLYYLFFGTSIVVQLHFWVITGILVGITQKDTTYLVFSLPIYISSRLKNILAISIILFNLLLVVIIATNYIALTLYDKSEEATRFAEKSKYLNQAIRFDPINPRYHKQLALLLANQAKVGIFEKTISDEEINMLLKEARAQLLFVKNLDPLYPQLPYPQAWISYLELINAKKYKSNREQEFVRAKADTLYAISRNPIHPGFSDLLTAVYLEMDGKMLDKAEENTKKTLQLKSDYMVAYHHLIEIYKQQGRTKDINKVCEQILTFDPDNKFAKDCLHKL